MLNQVANQELLLTHCPQYNNGQVRHTLSEINKRRCAIIVSIYYIYYKEDSKRVLPSFFFRKVV